MVFAEWLLDKTEQTTTLSTHSGYGGDLTIVRDKHGATTVHVEYGATVQGGIPAIFESVGMGNDDIESSQTRETYSQDDIIIIIIILVKNHGLFP
jgi:hypothetical protein